MMVIWRSTVEFGDENHFVLVKAGLGVGADGKDHEELLRDGDPEP